MRHAISPLDGRYGQRLDPLADCFSEFGLMKSRCEVELRFALALEKTGAFPTLTTEETSRINELLNSFGEADYQRIKAIEKETNHDVKAVEFFLREELKLANPNRIHFGLTSEDANNLAFTLSFKRYHKLQVALWQEVLLKLEERVREWKEIPFPARTHGQHASPTTAGKEMAVFLHRGLGFFKQLKEFRFQGKLNGATGNFSAMKSALPTVDWMAFMEEFVSSMDLRPNFVTTQIDDHDTWASWFNLTRSFNNVVMDLDQDLWLYISYGYIREKTVGNEVGSSTMPHKVNPINFENSEGNLQLSNALLVELSNKLTRSRMQRDLSDSTVTRNVGVALGHAHLALTETLKGLKKVQVNDDFCLQELKEHPQLLAEPIQTILRLHTTDDPYTLLKALTRGKAVTLDELHDFIRRLDIPEEVKSQLLALRVESYLGDATRICDRVLKEAKEEWMS